MANPAIRDPHGATIRGATMKLKAKDGSTKISIEIERPGIGDLSLWVPEAIATNVGYSAVYPTGSWQGSPEELAQTVPVEQSVGPGNCPRTDKKTFECCGIRFPSDNPVTWDTRVTARDDQVDFTVRLANLGDSPMHKAAAAICLKFLDAPWWSDETVFASAKGRAVSLKELGRDAGRPNGFQAYLLEEQQFDNLFYREFWGFNRHRLDRALLVSENRDAGVSVGIQCDAAYFMHSNPGNPCTDAMVAFGDIMPGQSATATGAVWVRPGRARELVSNSTKH
jgi:hypothetical protein